MASDQWDGIQWRRVERAPHYEVSNLGMVRRITPASGATVGKLLRLKTQRKGHLYVNLATEEGPKTYLVHHLVAAAFLPTQPVGTLVLHRDDDKENNTPSNLYYGSYCDNIEDARRNGTFAPGKRKDGKRRSPYATKRKFRPPLPEQVRLVRALVGIKSFKQIEAETGVSKSLAHRIATGEAYSDVI